MDCLEIEEGRVELVNVSAAVPIGPVVAKPEGIHQDEHSGLHSCAMVVEIHASHVEILERPPNLKSPRAASSDRVQTPTFSSTYAKFRAAVRILGIDAVLSLLASAPCDQNPRWLLYRLAKKARWTDKKQVLLL